MSSMADEALTFCLLLLRVGKKTSTQKVNCMSIKCHIKLNKYAPQSIKMKYSHI